MKGSGEVAEVFRRFGPNYRRSHRDRMAMCQIKAMHAIEVCRTSELGGHMDQCDRCGAVRISYNSCRNRHCPKCQSLNKERWLEARKRELLPIKYFHVVFTLPEDLRSLAQGNHREFYTLLFQSASATLKQLAADPKHLGADIGFMAMLHTWDQKLGFHPHLHCIVTGGGLTNDNRSWRGCKKRFFLPVRVISNLFRGKFLYGLKKSCADGRIRLSRGIKQPFLKALFNELYLKKWVVYCKPPLLGAESVIAYFARYAYRVAISNDRIASIGEDQVTIRYRDRANAGRIRSLDLDSDEFMRRFLLHILPDRLVKIRYYGIMSNRYRKEKLGICRHLLEGTDFDLPDPKIEPWQDLLKRVTGFDVRLCPECGRGTMVLKTWILPCTGGLPP